MENEEVPDVMTASYSEIMNSNVEEESTDVRKRPNRFPYNLEGTVSMDGNMTHFITENLEHKIKLSSPIAKSRESPRGDSRDSTPSTSGFQFGRPGGYLLPSEIDSNVLNDVEMEAQYLAASVDNLTENLCNLLHSISSITADNVEVYKNSVSKLTDCMDANIKNMYTIMAKTEEISNAIKPTKQLMNRIREIKRLVDMLENTL
ncbi:BLOC-1-related complex subunit 6 [Phlebotomus argentipes]|uniref:BLOC-1-related complex subunit 6 n=1 Tax=Phlebotomus argentipes TaxID=94469 RepID=UPI00289332EC|nr:BLOC-1-related complex subunit 6 [Phlebotomus argentipes]